MEAFKGFLFIMGIGVAVTTLSAIVMGLPLMLLWNYCVPHVFPLPEITYWQAVALNLISFILLPKQFSREDKHS